MKKIGANNYVQLNKVLGARIFQKDGIIKVAVKIDAKLEANSVEFSDPIRDVAAAEALIMSLNND